MTLLIFIPIAALITSSTFILSVYNALSIGQLFNSHRIIYSFVAYIGIHVISQVVSFTYIVVFMPKLIEAGGSYNFPTQASIVEFILPLVAVNAILGIAHFFSAYFILNKKLNLE